MRLAHKPSLSLIGGPHTYGAHLPVREISHASGTCDTLSTKLCILYNNNNNNNNNNNLVS